MESRLQSSEVRLPKIDSNFEFSSVTPCAYFQSSFARSLSFNTNQSQSLDFELSFRIGGGAGDDACGLKGRQNNCGISNDNIASVSDDNDITLCEQDDLPSSRNPTPPPLPATAPPVILCNGSDSGHSSSNSEASAAVGFVPEQRSNYTPKRRYTTNNVYRSQQDMKSKSISSEIEVLRLRKECQSLIEDNRRLLKVAERNGACEDQISCGGSNGNIVETVVLQNQIETLQWQLKQVESSRQMYHAVMEEVVRFLERCHQSLNSIQMNQISRSKSVSHVYGGAPEPIGFDTSRDNKPRLRTKTMDKAFNSTMLSLSENMDTNGTTVANDSFAAFKDFTWRRSPKNAEQLCKDPMIADPLKLSQEAFRLLRTAQNLLSVKEPILSESKASAKDVLTIVPPTPMRCSTPTSIRSTTPTIMRCNTPPTISSSSFSAVMQRKQTSRESRLSIQSSTDDSVHSTSSSRNETDEESIAHPPFCIMTGAAAPAGGTKSVTSSIDDESGFSSMNSFQEIGLPLPGMIAGTMGHHPDRLMPIAAARTRLSTTSNSSSYDNSRSSTDDDTSKNTTVKMRVSPIRTLPICHRRWSSAPPVPPKRNLSTFNGDEPLKVLWV